MRATSPDAGEETSRAVLHAALMHYERTIRALHDIMEDLQAGHLARAKDAKSALSELGKATQTAFDERSRLEKRLRTDGGVVDGYALDFAGARDEIGRRLARLRAADGAGSLPE